MINSTRTTLAATITIISQVLSGPGEEEADLSPVGEAVVGSAGGEPHFPGQQHLLVSAR